MPWMPNDGEVMMLAFTAALNGAEQCYCVKCVRNHIDVHDWKDSWIDGARVTSLLPRSTHVGFQEPQQW